VFAWVPNGGFVPLSQNPWQWALHLLLPWITLASLYAGIYARVLRGELINNMNEDYIRTARAKGLSERRILYRHALRCSLITIVSLFGLDVGVLVGGAALLTEVVFGLQGVGWLTYQGLQNLDLPLIMGCVMYGAFFVVLASAVVDVLYAYIDPRIRVVSR
jgi:peptide/nickel transport system permease protein